MAAVPYDHAARAGAAHALTGMSHEQARLARKLDAPTAVVVLLVVPALVLEFSGAGGALGVLSTVLNWAIYGWFVFEFAYMLRLAPSVREYFRNNKLDVLVLVTTFPLLPGLFQALWVLRLLRLVDVLPVVLGRFGSVTLLPYAIVLAFVAVFGGGLAFSRFEGTSILDGIYWANTTVNTVGYGDVSASTPAGKILSMVVQWSGNVVLALLIGGVAASAQRALLGDPAKVERKLDEIAGEVEGVGGEVEGVEEDVETLLGNVRGLSAKDRALLWELRGIKSRLEALHLESDDASSSGVETRGAQTAPVAETRVSLD